MKAGKGSIADFLCWSVAGIGFVASALICVQQVMATCEVKCHDAGIDCLKGDTGFWEFQNACDALTINTDQGVGGAGKTRVDNWTRFVNTGTATCSHHDLGHGFYNFGYGTCSGTGNYTNDEDCYEECAPFGSCDELPMVCSPIQ